MTLRQVHAALAVVWLGLLCVQVLLAGAAIANLGGSGDFSTHRDFGYTIGIVQLAVALAALAARLGRRNLLIALGILALYIVQTLLPEARGSFPFIAALHPLNALALFVLSAWYAARAVRGARRNVSAADAEIALRAGAASDGV